VSTNSLTPNLNLQFSLILRLKLIHSNTTMLPSLWICFLLLSEIPLCPSASVFNGEELASPLMTYSLIQFLSLWSVLSPLLLAWPCSYKHIIGITYDINIIVSISWIPRSSFILIMNFADAADSDFCHDWIIKILASIGPITFLNYQKQLLILNTPWSIVVVYE
jgi:hypothetical protein